MEGRQFTLNESSQLLLKTAIEAGITSPRELACLMGNADVETRGFSTMHENLRYRSAKSIIAAVSSADERFSLQEIEEAVASRDPREIAKILYENRSEIGNTEAGDGWKYHGRGYFQYTGRDNYRSFGSRFGVDLESEPDIAAEPETAAKLAIAYWRERVPARAREDIRASAQLINGGHNGLSQRMVAVQAWQATLTPELIADVARRPTSTAVAIQAAAADEVHAAIVAPLHHGSRGPDVRALQQSLQRLGYTGHDGQALKVDGDFGANTEFAVRAFQREHHLQVDGRAGHLQTLPAIDAAAKQLLTDPSHPRHALYAQALGNVHEEESRRHVAHGPHSERLAGAIAVAAMRANLTRIDRVELNEAGTLARAVQVSPLRDEAALNRTTAAVDTQAALRQSLQACSQQAREALPLVPAHATTLPAMKRAVP